MPSVPSKPKHRRWIRWAVQNVLWLAFTLLVLLVVAALSVTPLSLWAANRFLPEWRFRAEQVQIDRHGALTVRGLKVRLRRDGSEVLSAQNARATFSWRELRRRHVDAVEWDGLRVSANDASLAEVRKLLPADHAVDGGWKIDRIAVRGGFVKAAFSAQPQISMRVDAEIFSLGSGNAGGKPDALRLREIALRSDKGRGIVAIPDARLAFTAAELSAGHLRKLTIESPQVSLSQDEIAWFDTSSGSRASAMPWKVDELAITGGKMRVDIPSLPLIEGEVALHAEALGADPSGAPVPGELRIGKLTVTPRESRAAPASLAGATIQFTNMGLLSGRLQEVRLDSPSVAFNDAWSTILSGLGKGGASSPSEFPLKIDRLILDGGKADIALPGLPTILGTLTADFRNLGTPDAAIQRMEFHDLHIGLPDQPAGSFHEWLTLPKVTVTFNVEDLIRHHRLKSIELDGATLRMDRESRAMFAKAADASPSPAQAFVADEVHLRQTRVALDDLGLGMPPLDFSLNLDLTNVPLNDPLSGGTQEVQTLELSNINFVSPLDPFVPVLSLHSVFIRWTPPGLRERQIEEVVIVSPELNVGPDLFWYMDLVDKKRAAMESAAAGLPAPRPWRVKRFDAHSGKLILALAGQSRLTLPMPFESHAENLDFQRLSDAKLRLVLEVPPQDYENAELDIHLHGISGKIDFQLPPGGHAENVVQTLKVRDVRWKQFRGHDWWLGLTFDPFGMHGDGGGKICSGEIRAGFTYFLEPRAPWTGWVSGSRIDLQELTDKLAPGKASMTGRANVSLAVNGTGGDVTRLAGDFRAPTGGTLRITKLDELIAAIPAGWENAKRDLMRIGLETMRDFPYETGDATFWLTEPVGQLHVRLDGSLGKRELEVNFNPPGDLNRLFLFSPFKP